MKEKWTDWIDGEEEQQQGTGKFLWKEIFRNVCMDMVEKRGR